MIKYVVIVFIAMIIVYLILNCFYKPETFCSTAPDTDYNEYQNVLSNSQLSQMNNIIKAQLSAMFTSDTLIPGPKGDEGIQGKPGGTFLARGRLYNRTEKDMVFDNTLKPSVKLPNISQIWYVLSDGNISNEFINTSDKNRKKCLGDNLNFTSCNVSSGWKIDGNGKIKNNNTKKCLEYDGSKIISNNCSEKDNQKWFII